LDVAGRLGRERPRTWIFAGYSTSAAAHEKSAEFIRDVREGRKASLGGLDEQWNAKTTGGVIRDGRFVPLPLGEYPRSTDRSVLAKWVAYLGPRQNGAVPVEPETDQ
jgi:hypothetical protein